MPEPVPARDELHIDRVFDGPRELVFRCMTEPVHLTHFWGPTGMSTPLESITVDARPGGVFETVMVNDRDATSYRTRAIFDTVEEPETLAWTETDTGMRVTITFTALGERRTKVHIHQIRVPAAGMSPEARAGFLTALDRFERYLAHLSSDQGEPA